MERKRSMKRSRESGQVLPMIALTLAVLMGFSGLGVDVGYWQYHQREQQSATDAAAMGAAQQLLYSGCPSASVAQSAAVTDATSNGYTNGSNNVAVVAQNPPATGPYAGNTCAVSATITTQHVPAFFTKVFGSQFQQGVTESTQAVAAVVANNSGCVYMLGQGQNTNFHGSNLQAPGCSIYLNGSANFNGATIDAAAIGEADYSGSNNGGTFTGASPGKILPVADPCAEIAGCAYIKANPPSTSPCNLTLGTGALQPGCYNSLNAYGATVTLAPGTYVFAGGSNFNGASISGTGVTIYIPAGASTNFNKVSNMTLTPPATGNYADVTYYQVPSNSGDVNFNGSSTDISGLIYAPSAAMNYNGSRGGYPVLVAAYANFNGSSGEDFGSPPAGQTLIKNVVLAQ